MTYNPFDKSISKIEKDDLQKLIDKHVSEGWQIEYKSAFTDNLKIAQAIASFANSEGGWLIIGIGCDNNNEPTEIKGVELGDNLNLKDRMRDIVIGGIKPVPYFESKLVPLAANKVVIIVRVEQGDEPPYLTSNGVIYQRNGAGKQPVKDRHDLDKLLERAERNLKSVNKFCQNPFAMSKLQADSNQCLLEAYFWGTPFRQIRFEDFHTKEFFAQLKSSFGTQVPILVKEITSDLGLNKLSSGGSSYLLRQRQPGQELMLGLTLEIFGNGSMRLFFPMPQINIVDGNDPTQIAYTKSQYFKQFMGIIPQDDRKFLRVIDGYKLFTIIHVLIGQYCRFLESKNSDAEILMKVRLSDCWRTLLYLDDSSYLDFIKENGLPIGSKSEVEFPAGEGYGLPIKLVPNSATTIICNLYEALGLPLPFMEDSLSGIGKYLTEIVTRFPGESPK